MLQILAIAVALLLCGGCVTSTQNQPEVDFSVEDLREMRALQLTLRNLLAEDICISRANWPNADGLIRSEGVVVSIVVGDFRYAQITTSPYECFDFDREGLCELRIPPGGKLTATIPYDNFRLPTAFWGSAKVLDYEPSYYPCDAEFIPLPDDSKG